MAKTYKELEKENRLGKLWCFLENNELSFTYKLKEGWIRLEIGKLLFNQYGLNELLNT